MTIEFVPRWLIYNSVYADGKRLPKRELLVRPLEVKPSYKIIRTHTSKVPQILSETNKLVLADKLMGFENWEYRFWAVELKGTVPVCACCRMCGITLYNKEPRRKHLAEKGCSKIVMAYELLLRDSKCIICDVYTMDKYWGVPLCKTGNCMENFMHVESTPDALDRAIELTKSGVRP